jgi:predicted transposase/invertase (TIGR01784 family)
MVLTTLTERRAPEAARLLLNRAVAEIAPTESRGIIEMITTIMVYRFTNLTRQEVEQMLGITLQETRVYQDAKAEGRQEGRLEGERGLILRQLTRRLQQQLPETIIAQVQQLSLEQVEALGEALFEFQAFTDLEAWLQSQG